MQKVLVAFFEDTLYKRATNLFFFFLFFLEAEEDPAPRWAPPPLRGGFALVAYMRQVIDKGRQPTTTPTRVPLYPDTWAILHNFPILCNLGKNSLQKFCWLKKISYLCGARLKHTEQQKDFFDRLTPTPQTRKDTGNCKSP